MDLLSSDKKKMEDMEMRRKALEAMKSNSGAAVTAGDMNDDSSESLASALKPVAGMPPVSEQSDPADMEALSLDKPAAPSDEDAERKARLKKMLLGSN